MHIPRKSLISAYYWSVSYCVFVPFFCGWKQLSICVESANEVKDEDKDVYCEGACLAWFHAQCVSVSGELYAHLSDSEEKWECPSCQKSDLPPFNSVDPVNCFHF